MTRAEMWGWRIGCAVGAALGWGCVLVCGPLVESWVLRHHEAKAALR